MKVYVKRFVDDLEIKNKGIEIGVYDNHDKQIGDLVVTKTRLVWCRGKTTVENGRAISWDDFISFMES